MQAALLHAQTHAFAPAVPAAGGPAAAAAAAPAALAVSAVSAAPAGPTAAGPAAAPGALKRVNVAYCNSALWQEQHEACCNAVAQSPHTSIVVMPNHALNMDGELSGFLFSAHPQDSAAIMPVGKRMCAGVSMYECTARAGGRQPYNRQVLHVVNNLSHYRAALQAYMQALRGSECAPAGFSCIPARDADADTDVLDVSLLSRKEQHVWRDAVPDKLGLYHAYTSSSSSPFREHKLYVVVSGCQTHAAEELHNLWQDTKHSVTCAEFAECEELQWLRMATQRSHNRVAADVARIFELDAHETLDMDDPTGERCMLFPTTSTLHNDVVVCPQTGRILVLDNACLPANSNNGILFEMYSAEGFWLFHGPRDYSNGNPYGSEFACTGPDSAFPTRTSQFNERFKASTPADVVRVPRLNSEGILFAACPETAAPADDDGYPLPQEAEAGNAFLYPSESFMRTLQRLGFNRNDGITHLMPLVCYINDE